MKLVGIDFGTKRIGLAISDETLTLAREVGIASPGEIMGVIAELIKNDEVTGLVLGYPLGLSGEPTQKTQEVLDFKKELEKKFIVPVFLCDERLSSLMAESLPGGMKNTDSLAAQIILQNYLDKIKTNS
jgi:putative holliday junction resolvase